MTDPTNDDPIFATEETEIPEFEGRRVAGVTHKLKGGVDGLTRALHLGETTVLVIEARVADIAHPLKKGDITRAHVLQIDRGFELTGLPSLAPVSIFGIDPAHDVTVKVGETSVTADLGHRATAMVEVFGYGDTIDAKLANLAEVGRAITAQAEQLLDERATTETSDEDCVCAHCTANRTKRAHRPSDGGES